MTLPIQLQITIPVAVSPGEYGGQPSEMLSSPPENGDAGAFIEILMTRLATENSEPVMPGYGEEAASAISPDDDGRGNFLPVAVLPAATGIASEIFPDNGAEDGNTAFAVTENRAPQPGVPLVPKAPEPDGQVLSLKEEGVPRIGEKPRPLLAEGKPENPHSGTDINPQETALAAGTGMDDDSVVTPLLLVPQDGIVDKSGKMFQPENSNVRPASLQTVAPLPSVTMTLAGEQGGPASSADMLQPLLVTGEEKGNSVSAVAVPFHRSQLFVQGKTTPISAILAQTPSPVVVAGNSSSEPGVNIPSRILQGEPGLLPQAEGVALNGAGEPDLLPPVASLSQTVMAAAGKKESPDLMPVVLTQNPPAVTTGTGSSGLAPSLPSSPSLLLSPHMMNSAQWQNSLGERMVWMVKRELKQAELRLNPQHLGPVEVRIEVRNEQANITFSAHHAVTREALEAAIPRLREMLGEAGLSLANADVSQQRSGHGQQQDGGNGHQESHLTQSGMENHGGEEMPVIRGVTYGSSGLIDLFA